MIRSNQISEILFDASSAQSIRRITHFAKSGVFGVRPISLHFSCARSISANDYLLLLFMLGFSADAGFSVFNCAASIRLL